MNKSTKICNLQSNFNETEMKKILAAFVIFGFSVMAYSQQIKPGGRLIVNNSLFHGTVFTGEATSNCAFNADFLV
jgi:hypothetical protein